jgi:hypothetical protein
MQAIAGALEGLSRAEAARLAGMERQARRDAVVRCNAEGLAGLYSRPGSGRRARLSEEQQAALRRLVLDGPDVETTGLSAWTLPELCREVGGGALGRGLPRLAHGQADAPPRPVLAKGAALASEGGCGGARGVRKGGSKPLSTPRGQHIPASG